MATFVSVVSGGVPVENASVTIFSEVGAHIADSVTDNRGKALVVLDVGVPYYIRAYKDGLHTLYYSVTGAEGEFEVHLVPTTLTPSLDKDRCKVQGYVEDILGSPVKWPLSISAFEGVARGRDGLIYGDSTISPDDDGYYEFDLVKDVSYLVHSLPSGGIVECYTPNLDAISIEDFLFPVIVSIGEVPVTLNMAVGEVRTIPLSIVLSNTNVGSGSLLSVTCSDTAVTASASIGSLTISANKAGTSIVTVSQLVDPEENKFIPITNNFEHKITVEVG